MSASRDRSSGNVLRKNAPGCTFILNSPSSVFPLEPRRACSRRHCDNTRRRWKVARVSGIAIPYLENDGQRPVIRTNTAHVRRCARNDDSRIPLDRSEEHTSELQSLMRISYAVFGMKKKK